MRWTASSAVVESGHSSGLFADFLPKRRRFDDLHPRAEAKDKVSQLARSVTAEMRCSARVSVDTPHAVAVRDDLVRTDRDTSRLMADDSGCGGHYALV